jgi:hypothetical protein
VDSVFDGHATLELPAKRSLQRIPKPLSLCFYKAKRIGSSAQRFHSASHLVSNGKEIHPLVQFNFRLRDGSSSCLLPSLSIRTTLMPLTCACTWCLQESHLETSGSLYTSPLTKTVTQMRGYNNVVATST